MKRVILVVLLIVAAAVLGLWRSNGGVRQNLGRVVGAAGDSSAPTSDETRKSFSLKPGAHVVVQGINGKVEIQTSDTTTAEVYVRRTADNASSLQRREMIVEQTDDGFVVRGRQNNTGFWDHLFGRNPQEEVTIKAPRDIALSLRGISGGVKTGDIVGPLEANAINGGAEFGWVNQPQEIRAVNGSISIGLKGLDQRGARFSAVNGGIELKLAGGLNADFEARSTNGNVESEIPEVKIDKDDSRSRYYAHVGSGGPLIEISAINGGVRLIRGEGATATSTTANEKKAPASNQKSDQSPAAEKSSPPQQ